MDDVPVSNSMPYSTFALRSCVLSWTAPHAAHFVRLLIKEFGLRDKFLVLSKHDITALGLIRDTPTDTPTPVLHCETDPNAATAIETIYVINTFPLLSCARAAPKLRPR